MLVASADFIGNFENQRICWIGGRLGGHKTSFAYLLASRFLDRGYRLVSNNLSVWTDTLRDVRLTDDGFLKSFIILDEGGLFFESSEDVKQVAAYLSKMDCYIVLPSATPPSRTAHGLILQPVWSFFSIGLPLILYQWRLSNLMQKGGGLFAWYRPSQIYGIYSRRDPGTNCDEIREFIEYRTMQYKKLFEREPDYSWKEEDDKNQVSGMERKRREIDPSALAMEDAAGALADSVAGLETVSKRINRRRWRRL